VTSPSDYRLPKHIRPSLYELKMQLHIGPLELLGNKSFTFEGENKMSLVCANATDKLVFHSVGLELLRLQISIASEQDANISVDTNYVYDFQREWAVFTLNKLCIVNATYVLTVPYRGVISDMLFGLYRSSYKDSNSQIH
jgi:hypothetical protein